MKRWFSYSGVLLVPATLSSVSLLPSSEYLPSSKESNVDRLEVRTAREKVGGCNCGSHTPRHVCCVHVHTHSLPCTWKRRGKKREEEDKEAEEKEEQEFRVTV